MAEGQTKGGNWVALDIVSQRSGSRRGASTLRIFPSQAAILLAHLDDLQALAGLNEDEIRQV
jgi:hypothetical protein